MTKTSIKIQDLAFIGDKTSSKYHDSKMLEWDRSPGYGPIIFFTDSCLNLVNLPCYKNSYKIAWLIEPTSIRTDSYQYSIENKDKFDLILTHHTEFLKVDPKIQYYPQTMSWVAENDWGQYPKSKNITIIASEKNWAPGHQIRHQIINKYRNNLDIYGRGYRPIQHKIEVLKDSRFQFAIENCNVHNYWSEKVLDCFYTHTIPIFWGTDGINEFFDSKGMVQFKSIDELDDIINEITANGEDLYKSVFPYIEENFRRAVELGPTIEDWVYKNILKPKGLV